MSSLAVFRDTLPIPGWQWRTGGGLHLPPADMETSHLFHTLRMIWNNFMPAHMRVGAVRLYRFNPQIWPKEFLGQAIRQVGHELFNRPDLEDWMRFELEQMARWLLNREKTLPTPVLMLEGDLHETHQE